VQDSGWLWQTVLGFGVRKLLFGETKPFNMAKTVAKKKTLIGLYRKEVISKPGYFKETQG
jgi:hypothetical protein